MRTNSETATLPSSAGRHTRLFPSRSPRSLSLSSCGRSGNRSVQEWHGWMHERQTKRHDSMHTQNPARNSSASLPPFLFTCTGCGHDCRVMDCAEPSQKILGPEARGNIWHERVHGTVVGPMRQPSPLAATEATLRTRFFLNSATATQRPRPARASTPATIGCSRKLYRHCTISKDASHAPTSAMHRPGTALCVSPLLQVGLRVLLFDPLRIRKQLWHIFLALETDTPM